jgi:hypothetical protein
LPKQSCITSSFLYYNQQQGGRSPPEIKKKGQFLPFFIWKYKERFFEEKSFSVSSDVLLAIDFG